MQTAFARILSFVIFLLTANLYGQQEKEYYQLKTYLVKNDAQEQMVDDYLAKAFLPAVRRYGIQNIGVFKQHLSKFNKADKIYVLIPFSSLLQFENLEAFLLQDKAHAADGENYLKAAHDKVPYENMNSVLLRAFAGMPKMAPSKIEGLRTDRVYELRSYESPTEAALKNKVHMFNEGGEIKLFDRLGFNAVFYAEVLSGDAMPNLMYMTTFTHMEAREKLWKAFFASDKWTALINDPYYKNNMKKADIMQLYPTAYSDY